MNSVASGRRANVKHRIAYAARLRAHHLVLAHEAEAERVDENIPVVRRVEHHLARDGRHADAIAVTADSADHAAEQVARPRMIERSELERVHARDRPRAHREDVAQDSADAGRRALVRLDERRMVVAFDFEHRDPSVADVDRAGVLARSPCTTSSLFDGSVRRCLRDDLYEQCSDHITEKTPSSVKVGDAAEDLFDLAILVGRKAVRARLLDDRLSARPASDTGRSLIARSLQSIEKS